MNWRDLRLRLRAILFRDRVERELAEELAFHIAMQTAKHSANGMTPADARRRAEREFGNVDRAREESRDARGLQGLDAFTQDARYAIRGFLRAPGFALTVILTIGLGLGLNAAVFTIFNAYVLKPRQVRDPHSLYEVIWAQRAANSQGFESQPLASSEYHALTSARLPFEEMLGYTQSDLARIGGRVARGHLVSGNFFDMLGATPALGRTLVPSDVEGSRGAPVAVLSYQTWMSRFGGDSTILGDQVWLGAQALEIVGVARKGFQGLGNEPPQFWAPLTVLGPPRWVNTVVRKKPGTSVRSAESSLLAWSRGAMRRVASDSITHVVLRSGATWARLSRNVLFLYVPVGVAFFLVLALACANVGGMMLARGLARQREIGIRLALGAARGRLIRQLLTECLLLALPAGILGFQIARGTVDLGVRFLITTMPPSFVPHFNLVSLEPDVRVITFMLLAAVVSAVLFGLAPALQATRPGVVHATRGDFDSPRQSQRLRSALVLAQIVGCVLLLVTASVLLRGGNRLEQMNLGFRTQGVLRLEPAGGAIPRLLQQLNVNRDVVAVAPAVATPLISHLSPISATSEAENRDIRLEHNFVSSAWFGVLEIPIVHGRLFTPDEERDQAPVAIVSETAASRLWPGAEPVGQVLRLALDPASAGRRLARFQNARVVGVAGEIASGGVSAGPDLGAVYFPVNPALTHTELLVQVRGSADSLRRTIDTDLNTVLPGSVLEITPLDDLAAGGLFPLHVASGISLAVGVIALVLTVTGVYGVLSFMVAQRTREIGIRMALGAGSTAIVRLVVGQSLRLAALGLVVGMVGALGVSKALSSVLEMIDMFDMAAYGSAALVVLMACVAAAWIPSRRAVRLAPAVTLRND